MEGLRSAYTTISDQEISDALSNALHDIERHILAAQINLLAFAHDPQVVKQYQAQMQTYVTARCNLLLKMDDPSSLREP